jgi:formate/nitrite transporter FocA (FNT family)
MTDVSGAEREEAQRRERPRMQVIYEAIRHEGERALERKPGALFLSAFAAGLSMTFSLIASGALRAALPETPWRPLVSGIGYTLGFLIVILGRQQLFTENTLTPLLPVFAAPSRWNIRRAVRLWALVLGGNLLGAAISAALVARSGAFTPAVMASFDAIAREGTSYPVLVTFVKAVFAGWLIALMVWLLPLAEAAAPFIIVLLTYFVAVAAFSHVIAGSVEAMYGAFRGVVGWPAVVLFFVPTLLGNIVGGVAFVAAGASAEVAIDRD